VHQLEVLVADVSQPISPSAMRLIMQLFTADTCRSMSSCFLELLQDILLVLPLLASQQPPVEPG
jgi:hypothetical protein